MLLALHYRQLYSSIAERFSALGLRAALALLTQVHHE